LSVKEEQEYYMLRLGLYIICVIYFVA